MDPTPRRGNQGSLNPIGAPWILFSLTLVLTVAGFWPSFFAALPAAKLPHQIHGWSATAWMLLPLVQAWLIHTRRRKAHRWIGWAALPLAAVVVVSGLRVIQMMVAQNAVTFTLVRIKFVLLDLTGLLLFSVFVGLSIAAARRRDIGQHVRWIACSALIPLEAALERLLINLFPFWVSDFEAGLFGALIVMEAIVTILIVVEWRRDRIRSPFPLLLGYYVLMHVSVTPVAKLAGFQAFSKWFSAL